MSKNRTHKAPPQECYIVLGDYSLVVITQGVQGYRRSPLDSGNPQTNRIIADAQNRKLGVTREQASAMFKTATLIRTGAAILDSCQVHQNHVFEAYIFHPNNPDDLSGVSIKLPATPYEILDGLEKAHIADGKLYMEVISEKLDCLSEMLSPTTNLHELNHLAERLSVMSDWELNCFEGMVMMETAKTDNSPIPLERLINFTHSIGDCQIAYGVSDDKSLGKFYVDNDFPVIPENLPEVLYEMLDYEAIGRKQRTGEGGVFTDKGYVVHSGEIAQIYKSGDAAPQEKPNYTIMLEVCKGYFNDPAYDNKLSEFLLLPADDGILDRAIAQVEAASIEECSVKAVDCIVPKLSTMISDALYASEGDCYGAVNELANQLQRLEQSGKLYTYKAMVEAAPQDITLDEALDLAGQVDWFCVTKEANSPAAYARDILSKYYIEQADELYASTNLRRYGEKLIAEKGISMTGYGALWSLDGQTVEQRLGRTEPSMTMEMK